MKKYNIGFLGAGNIFHKHQKAINNKKYLSIKGVYDTKKTLKKLKKYNNERDIFSDNDIDLIALLTPSGNHFKGILKSLSQNKHVIVEKPLVLKLDQIEKIITHKNKLKKKVFVVFQHRLNPCVLKLKKILRRKVLGKIFLVSSRLYWSRGQDYYKNSNWRGTWKHDGGVTTNQGIHTIDILVNLFGLVESVFARSKKVSKYIETEDVSIVSMKFKNGIICNMEFTTAVRPSNLENSITVLGSKGYFVINGTNFNQFSSSLQKISKKVNISSLHGKFYSEIYKSLKNNKKNIFSPESCIIAQEVLTAIYQSLKLKKEIKFPIKKNIHIRLGS